MIVIAVAAVSCTSNGGTDTSPIVSSSTTSMPTTTTTIDDDTCEDVADDSADFLEDLVEALDEAGFREVVDQDVWSEDLRSVQQAGRDLDLRATALRCDPAAIQAAALEEADLDPEGRIATLLVELLGG